MHPGSAFRAPDREWATAIVEEVGFGMVFAATPDGPRVAHTPLVLTGDGALQFHLARGNGLTRGLDGAAALALVNGPDGYVSPRWYADAAGAVPTWNYVAVEMEGRVRRMDEDGLVGLLETLSARHEGRLPAPAWTLDRLDAGARAGLLAGIAGFEMEIAAWRPTFKLSQNRNAADRAGVAAGLEGSGAAGIAALMRGLAA
ncbi:FMN-binding negative transcriptional regulator [Parablastomonas sp. CN1-191]|uniref:FMN-binding negative transcriptional regulator n=1 Tax=Parablastomonas sp. CN1-191 TaxID=3400908 RepID=UPI003BF8DCFF